MEMRFKVTEFDGCGGLREPVYFEHLEDVIDYLRDEDLSQFAIEERVDITNKIHAYMSADVK